MVKTIRAAMIGLLSAATLAASALANEPLYEVAATKNLLGTKIDMLVMHSRVDEARRICKLAFEEIQRVEALLSSHSASSEITRINRAPGGTAVKVSAETLAILARAKKYAQQYDGLFDVTIGPLSSLWGFNGDKPVNVPAQDKIQALLRLVNYRNIKLSPADTTVTLMEQGMEIDLGGIAKGYAIDRAARVFKSHNLHHFLINAGGDIYASGSKAPNRRWRVGIQHPRQPQELLAAFELSDRAVATSGDYERFAIIDGKRYHHVLDPKTGSPSPHCQSVTVFAATAEEADVLATYLFVLGYENYRKRFGEQPLESIFVEESGDLRFNPLLFETYALEFMR